MLVKVKLTALAQGQWYEYVIRFVLGGLIAALAGLIAVAWCPLVGGLFLAFPATSRPVRRSSKSTSEKKERSNFGGARRGTEAAASRPTARRSEALGS